jgi:ADP-ribose pyrophosphatase YjhB (NUDIX family)
VYNVAVSRFITLAQFKKLTSIPRGILSVRTQVYCGVIVENQGKIVLVKSDDKYGGYDFPGGKLLWSEDIKSCAKREVLEEARYKVRLKSLLGVYQRRTGPDDEDYLRFVFIGCLMSLKQNKTGDPNILDVKWTKISDIRSNQIELRSGEVKREVDDYAMGKSFPLKVLEMYVW